MQPPRRALHDFVVVLMSLVFSNSVHAAIILEDKRLNWSQNAVHQIGTENFQILVKISYINWCLRVVSLIFCSKNKRPIDTPIDNLSTVTWLYSTISFSN
eukprot:TRINITY_DN11329_c0_g1_i1.p2 TRINITY_DN11329_c0_g1~~TRINITY_DN11329_c0_g1_i1.p2  ORF type:complete len:100 (+),score=4.40 TRINITY_DN11329_c0_g1_i1:3658-3957(+)